MSYSWTAKAIFCILAPKFITQMAYGKVIFILFQGENLNSPFLNLPKPRQLRNLSEEQ